LKIKDFNKNTNAQSFVPVHSEHETGS